MTRLAQRFVFGRLLGRGAFGEVHEAWDNEREARVAVKRLSRVEPATLQRFRAEFRAMADLVHPNLVQLHELIADDDAWLFTMRLVDGVDFGRFVRGGVGDAPTVPPTMPTWRRRTGVGPPAVSAAPASPASDARVDLARLRSALRQLVSGVVALHRAGFIHRDLKPSNVLVTPGGDVQILDFGLVAGLSPAGEVGGTGVLLGTPAYMAPEQARGEATTPATDWYAVGVMLFEALTGSLPYAGALEDMLRAKVLRDAPDARTLAPETPEDLAQLAARLLVRAPEARAEATEIAERTGAVLLDAVGITGTRATFVGRERELEALVRAYDDVRPERPVVVHLHGPAGIGKSALTRRFGELVAPYAWVLRTSCHERESVPFKALDGLMSSLVEQVDERELEALVGASPPDEASGIEALEQLCPALGRASFAAAAHAPAPRSALRRQAVASLRTLLGRLARRRPLVLVVDDAQWGDRDSAALIAEALGPPSPPGVLLLVASRLGPAELEAAFPLPRATGVPIRSTPVPPLEGAAALQLAALAGAPADEVSDVVNAAGGFPFLIIQLAQQHAAHRTTTTSGLTGLAHDPWRLLAALCLGARPWPEDWLRRASDLAGERFLAARSALVAHRLIRTRFASGAVGRASYEPYHERIREQVLATLEADLAARLHRRMAEVLRAEGGDAESIAHHLEGSGDHDGAQAFWERAAEDAAARLAFQHAVDLYRRALASRVGAEPPRTLLRALGHALADAGHGPEAARVLLEAVRGETGSEAAAIRRRAGEQLLRAGRIDEGLAVLAEVLADVGLDPVHASDDDTVAALRSTLATRVRDETPCATSAPSSTGLDALWSLAHGLAGIDPIRSAFYSTTHALRALASGDVARAVRALSWEAIVRGLEGAEGADELIERAEALTREGDDEHDGHDSQTFAWPAAAGAAMAFSEARWRESAAMSAYAASLFRQHGADVAWPIAILDLWWRLPACYALAERERVTAELDVCLREARTRGDDLALATGELSLVPLLHLDADRPDLARSSTAEGIARTLRARHPLHAWSHDHTLSVIDLYQGDPVSAHARLTAERPTLLRAALDRYQHVRLQGAWIEGLADLAAGLDHDALAAPLGVLARDPSPLAAAMSDGLLGARLAIGGDPERARVTFERAILRFADLAMPDHVDAHRACLGLLVAGDAGRELQVGALTAMAGRGVVRPAQRMRIAAPLLALERHAMR